jgi:hypothetical protein
MKWLEKYDQDLASLEKVRAKAFPVDLSKPADLEAFSKDFEAILATLKGKKIDSAAIEVIATLWWNRSKATQVASLKKEIKIQLRLVPLYTRLKNASKADLSEYGLVVFRHRLQSPVFRKLIAESSNNRPSFTAEPSSSGLRAL